MMLASEVEVEVEVEVVEVEVDVGTGSSQYKNGGLDFFLIFASSVALIDPKDSDFLFNFCFLNVESD
jgi:hypothetical protein